ncbi:ABC transporter substrate-binding protein [Desulfobotulus sp. H1]|uniref:ABC transporter substrate-binding protein n=1 Tax=Desulfobotulus pelophilus TaxID=2823377 RepID=A0ABT3NBM8_9BACT|nr:ABC transporter substrate-binding protein [Desulfobotulus pelophilus]MCW7754870.1 ABC transporter substrate-binding protein [Desulfobotulus pelophilus]
MGMRSMRCLLSVLLVMLAGLSFADMRPVRIGISKIVAHPALDALEQGVQDGLRESWPNAVFDLQNANGDLSTAASIAQKFRAQKVDLAVGIATPTSQALVNLLRDQPVIYCAVTDPVDAGLVDSYDQGGDNVTGYSDMTPVAEQIDFLLRVRPMKRLGHIYASGEANAVRLAEIARRVCEARGIEFVESTVANSAEVRQAIQAIIRRVDGVYLSNDNTVFAALPAVSEVCMRHRVPLVTADPSSARNIPVLAAWGFDYYRMGLATGRLAGEVLSGTPTADIPTQYMKDPSDMELLVNLDVAAMLGVEIPADLLEQASILIKNGQVTEVR